MSDRPSFERINYSLRPAKCIERKMLCEAYRRLASFGDVTAYRYVGLGSPFFVDFALVHRTLGISQMICIEREEESVERFMANRPFDCIQLKFGNTNDVLPKLDWQFRSIVWLDYDGRLTASALDDVRTVLTSLVPGSLVIVSLNAHPSELEEGRLHRLRSDVGSTKVPADVDEKDLRQWGTASTYRRILLNEIMSIVSQRNGARSANQALAFKQLFYFQYADGAKMMTFGGLLHDAGQKAAVAQSCFDALKFVRLGEDPYKIEVPCLTWSEMRRIESFLPLQSGGELFGVPKADVEAYARLYPYFPKFAESDI